MKKIPLIVATKNAHKAKEIARMLVALMKKYGAIHSSTSHFDSSSPSPSTSTSHFD